MKVTDQIREEIKWARRARGLTLKQVEEMTNGEIKAVTLGTWERGTRCMSMDALARLADVYGMTPIIRIVEKDK